MSSLPRSGLRRVIRAGRLRGGRLVWLDLREGSKGTPLAMVADSDDGDVIVLAPGLSCFSDFLRGLPADFPHAMKTEKFTLGVLGFHHAI